MILNINMFRSRVVDGIIGKLNRGLVIGKKESFAKIWKSWAAGRRLRKGLGKRKLGLIEELV